MNDKPIVYNEGVYRGLGRPECVLAAWASALEEVPEVAHDLREAMRVMNNLYEFPDTRTVVVAFACAVLNREYRETGMMFACDQNGIYGVTHDESQHARQANWIGLLDLKY